MTYTEDDEKHDKSYAETDENASHETSESSSKHKLPFAPAEDDDSPLGSTDQHSEA
ncbi:MAG: hypothetical protein WCB67_01780 [Solirubrobacteraceae bacterium]